MQRMDEYVFTCDKSTNLIVNYTHENGEKVTLSFLPVDDDLMHVRYHLHGADKESYVADMGFVARVNDEFPNYFTVVRMDKDADYRKVEKWLGKSAVDSEFTNLQFIDFLYLMSIVTVCHFRDCLTCVTKRNGDISMTPVFGFRRKVAEIDKELATELLDRIRYEGWDVIHLTDDEYVSVHNLMDDVPYPTLGTLSIEKMCIRLAHKSGNTLLMYYVWNDETDILEITMRDEEMKKNPVIFNIFLEELPDGDDGKLKLHSKIIDCNTEGFNEWANEPIHEGGHDSNGQGLVAIFFDINRFLLHFGKMSMNVKEIECTKRSTGKREHTPAERTTTRLYKCYTLKKNWETKVERKKAEFRCLAWGVRGHFRHYKSGKVVFIAPFVKGKEKDKYKGKDYIFFPKDNNKKEGA